MVAPPPSKKDLIEMAKARKQAVIAGARERCEDMVSYAFSNEQNGLPVRNADFHVEWQKAAREHPRLILFAPVEHAKTQHLGIAKPLHLLGQNPNRRIAIISNTQEQAQKNLRSIRQHIERNVFVREVFPGLRPSDNPEDPWRDDAITVQRTVIAKDPSIQVCGCYGNIVGSRLDVIILDDVLDFDNTRTPEQRQKLVEWFETTVFTRLTKDGIILIIGTPWDNDDLMHVLSKRPGFKTLRYSAVKNPDDPPRKWETVWKEQWPLDRLLDRYDNTTEHTFLRKYLCRVRVDSAGRFRAAWIEKALTFGKGRVLETTRFPKLPNGQRMPCFTGVDLGVGEKNVDALTCIFTIGITHLNQRLVVNIEAGRWPSPEIIDRIHRAHLVYGSEVAVESNGAQKFLVQHARQLFPVRALFTTGSNKHHEEFGVEGLAVDFRNGAWVLPSGSDGKTQDDEQAAWVGEMLNYSPDAHTGDRLMASWIASEAARLFGVPRFGKHNSQQR